MTSHSVVIAGGGPTGLMLAGELALAGVDVAVVERRPSQELHGARALGISSRTIEVLDQRGIADRFLAAGQTAQVAGFAVTRLDISDFPTRHNYGLALRQKHIERILAGWVTELGVPILYGREITGFVEDDTGVDVALADGQSLRARYLVGCDGGRSLVRKTAGIDFPGWEATTSNLLAEVEMTETPPYGVHRSASGTYAFGRSEFEIEGGKIVYKDVGPIEVMVTEPNANAAGEPTLRDLKALLVAACGTDFGVHSPTWISRFTDTTRQAASYRRGRVLLAGDAAHVHSPIGGQGLSSGVQDAVNLGWKLAQVVKGTSPDSLLDTYHAERHPVAARVLETTMAQVALHREDDRTLAAREIVGELLAMDEPRKRMAGMMSGLDIRYDLGEGHPLLGRRMPDLDIVTASGPRRVFSLLHDARPVLLDLAAPGAIDIAPWSDRVQHVDATYAGTWELPVIGEVDAPAAVLIRPDGYVAWVGDGTSEGLTDALTTWFGPPTNARVQLVCRWLEPSGRDSRRARAGSAWRPRHCGAASPRSARAVACWQPALVQGRAVAGGPAGLGLIGVGSLDPRTPRTNLPKGPSIWSLWLSRRSLSCATPRLVGSDLAPAIIATSTWRSQMQSEDVRRPSSRPVHRRDRGFDPGSAVLGSALDDRTTCRPVAEAGRVTAAVLCFLVAATCALRPRSCCSRSCAPRRASPLATSACGLSRTCSTWPARSASS